MQRLRARLKELLPEDEYAAARASTPFAHYTGPSIVNGIYTGLQRMGFDGGRIGEPGFGIGNFAGLMPPALRDAVRMTGIELDPTSAAIAKLLYPGHDVRTANFIQFHAPDGHFDVMLGNPPFSSRPVTGDERYAKQRFMLHDYFIAKSLDLVRPGGLAVFVTSKGTMDKQDAKMREYINERADMVSAIRLPQTAFKENAGTDVITDILVFRKRAEGEQPAPYAQDWLKTAMMKDGVAINNYFLANPRQVLGRMETRTGQYGPELSVVAVSTIDIETAIRDLMNELPANIYEARTAAEVNDEAGNQSALAPEFTVEGQFFLQDGKLMRNVDGAAKPVLEKKPKVEADATHLTAQKLKAIKLFVPYRDAVRAVLDAQLAGVSDKRLAELQKTARMAQKQFWLKVGPLTKQKVVVYTNPKTGEKSDSIRYPNESLVQEDPAYNIAIAAELYDADTEKAVASDLLTKRTIDPNRNNNTKISGPKDALPVVLNARGELDMEEIAKLSNMTTEQAAEKLGDSVFSDPTSETWRTADEYLSGDVKTKLDQAREAASTNPAYERNVKALEAVQPRDRLPSEISITLGSPLLEPKHIADFAREVMGVSSPKVQRIASGGFDKWTVNGHGGLAQWQHSDRSASQILELAISRRPVIVTRRIDGTDVRDHEAETQISQIISRITDSDTGEWRRWIFKDEARRDALVKLYNERLNRTRERRFDGSHLTIPDMNVNMTPHPHQLDAVWRNITTGSMYAAHQVGAGKTLFSVIAGREMKRLGLINKPMYVVPNHVLKQFQTEYLNAFPQARLLVADESNFAGNKRRTFIARAAANDWDAVLISHSAFARVGVSGQFEGDMIRDEIAEYRAALTQVDKDDRRTVKQIEDKIKRLGDKLLALRQKKDAGLTFEDMGADYLFVDEAHEFRKLTFATSQGNIKGINPNGSQRAWALFTKIRYLSSRTPGRAATFMSGTPITNTMGELYSLLRFLNPSALRRSGTENFDSWAAMFGSMRSDLEVNPAGEYSVVNRFDQFVNLPALAAMWREIGDYVATGDLPYLKLPEVDEQNVLSVASPAQIEYKKELADRLKAIQARGRRPQKGEDNHLVVITDGRHAALDERYINPSLPPRPESKIGQAIANIVQIHKDTAKERGTQAVFLDMGIPDSASAASRGFSAYDAILKGLLDAGIPRNEIIIIQQEGKSYDRKRAAFARVSKGQARIIIGSTAAMGTGANMQQRLKALHLVDPGARYLPADDTQRRGRIVRQGNMWSLLDGVKIRKYITKDTYDEQIWGMLQRKQGMINQFLQAGTEVGQAMDDIAAESAFEEAKALASGNKYVRELANAKAELQKMQISQANFENTEKSLKDGIDAAKESIEYNKNRISGLETIQPLFADTKGDAFEMEVMGKVFDTRKDAGYELLSRLKKPTTNWQNSGIVIGRIGGFEIRANDGSGLYKHISAWGVIDNQSVKIAGFNEDLVDSIVPVGLVQKIENLAASIPRKLESARAEINQSEQAIKSSQLQLSQLEWNDGPALERLLLRVRYLERMVENPENAEQLEGDYQIELRRAGLAEDTEPIETDMDKSESTDDDSRRFSPQTNRLPPFSGVYESPVPYGKNGVDAAARKAYLVREGVKDEKHETALKTIDAILNPVQGDLFADAGITLDPKTPANPLYGKPLAPKPQHRSRLGIKPSPRKLREIEQRVNAERAAWYSNQWEAAFNAVGEGRPVMRIIPELIAAEMPMAVPVDGMKLERGEHIHAVMTAIRSPYFESFKTVWLDSKGVAIRMDINSIGVLDASLVHPAMILRSVPPGASAVILSHNHPGGDPSPSAEDLSITRKIMETLTDNGIVVMDHVITNGTRYFSMRESGVVKFPAAATSERAFERGKPVTRSPRPIPETIGQANWEINKLEDMQHLKYTRPSQVRKFIGQFADGDKFIHALYTNTRNVLVGVERISPDISAAKISALITRNASIAGAACVILHLPSGAVSADTLKWSRAVIDRQRNNDIKLLDIVTPGAATHPQEPSIRFQSYRESELVAFESTDPYGGDGPGGGKVNEPKSSYGNEGKQDAEARRMKHWTTEESAKALNAGAKFDPNRNAVHAIMDGKSGKASSSKFAGNRLYLSLDDSAWNKTSSVNKSIPGQPLDLTNIKEVNEETDESYYDYTNQKWMVRKGAKTKKTLTPVEYVIDPGARVLLIDSPDTLANAVKIAGVARWVPGGVGDNTAFWDGLQAAGYDVVEIRNVKNIEDRKGFFASAGGDQAVILNMDKVSHANDTQAPASQADAAPTGPVPVEGRPGVYRTDDPNDVPDGAPYLKKTVVDGKESYEFRPPPHLDKPAEEVEFEKEKAESLWRQSLDLAFASVARMRGKDAEDKNARPDISKLDLLLSTISHYSEKVPGLRKVYEAADRWMDNKHRFENLIFNQGDDGRGDSDLEAVHKFTLKGRSAGAKFNPLSTWRNPEWTRLEKYLWTKDMNAKGYRAVEDEKNGGWIVLDPDNKPVTPPGDTISLRDNYTFEHQAWEAAHEMEAADLRKAGFSEDAASTLLAIRRINDRAYNQLAGELLAAKDELDDLGLSMPRIKKADGEMGDIFEALREIGNRRGYYMPRMRRSGKFILIAKKEGENSILEKFDTKGFRLKRANALKRKGYETEYVRSDRPEETAYMDASIVAMNDMMQNALERVKKLEKDHLGLAAFNLAGRWEDYKTKNGQTEKHFIVEGPSSKQQNRIFKDIGGKWMTLDDSPKTWRFIKPHGNVEKRIVTALVQHESHRMQVSSFAETITENIADMIHQRGSRSHKIGRSDATGKDVYMGYEQDALKAVTLSGKSIAGGTAKRLMAKEFMRAMTGQSESWMAYRTRRLGNFLSENPGVRAAEIDEESKQWYHDYAEEVSRNRIDSATQGNAYKDAVNFAREMLRNQVGVERIVGTVKGLAAAKYMSSISSGLVNLTSMYTHAPAAMSAFAGIKLGTAVGPLIHGAMRDYMKFAAHEKFGKGQGLSGEAQELYKEIAVRGWDAAQFNHEALAVLQGNIGGVWSKTINAGMISYAVVERLARMSTIAATYRGIKAQHKGEWTAKHHEDALTKAKYVSDKTNSIFGKTNLPSWARGEGGGQQMLRSWYMFKSFPHNTFLLLKEAGLDHKDIKAAAWLLVAPAFVGGASASLGVKYALLPAVKMTLAALARVIPDFEPPEDPEEGFYAWLNETLGEWAERTARFGIVGGVANVSVKGSLETRLDDWLPFTLKDFIGESGRTTGNAALNFLGAPASAVTDIGTGVYQMSKGNVIKGLEDMGPRFTANLLRAYREATEGVTGRGNQPLFYGIEPMKATWYETLQRAVGFYPATIAEMREKQWSDREIEFHYSDRRTDIYDRVRKYHLKQRANMYRDADWLRITTEIKEYNARIKARDLGDAIPFITGSQIGSTITRMKTPPKRERVRAWRERQKD